MPAVDDLVATRLALHTLAEHVLGAALLTHRNRIGLRPVTGGFATQEYPWPPGPGGGLRRLAVVGTDLVVRDDDLAGGVHEEREPLTTVRAAAARAGIAAGLPDTVYHPATPLDLDGALTLVPGATVLLADVLAVGHAALLTFSAAHAGRDPAEIQLWPEHFDLATSFDEVNYGVSMGDAGHPWPYAYVGPWSPVTPDDGYWNEPFGASLVLSEVPTVEALVAFFAEGRERTEPH